MNIYTQYTYEKNWIKTAHKDLLRMIKEEMPNTDVQGTLKYIVSQTEKRKTITLGSCRFKGSI